MSLTREQRQQVEALFEVAVGQPVETRENWLKRQRLDPLVHAEVNSLLAASETAGDLPSIVLTDHTVDDAEPLTGERLGPWRLLGLLGRGGMGEVYRAERADGAYQQQVALKLLKRGVDTDAVLRRFLRERRILGSLSHPHIARLLDAGAAPDGRPYLVMELVDGRPITDWCLERKPDTRGVLELMIGVCEAVHAAHRQQVVHRDLKPSNVLVDEHGEAKLLDFGIAKLVGEDEVETRLTAFGTTPATPQYAAPEQLLSEPVTPASDVFSLGVLLYELLTGALPSWRQNALMAIAAAKDHRPITRPSVAVSKSHEPAWADEVRRGQRRRELDGDLDQILLKALDPEPARRYATAAELADDLRRYLDGRPVLAQPDSWLYVARKFIVRNWVQVSAAVAVAFALIAGAGLALWQAHRAQREAALARQVVAFQGALLKRVDIRQFADGWFSRTREKLASTLEQSKPIPPAEATALLASFDRLRLWSQPAEVARETLGDYLLAPAVKEIDQRFAGDPRTTAVLRTEVGGAYTDLGLMPKAEQQLRQAIAEAMPVLGPDSVEVLAAQLKLADVLRFQGGTADAIALAREVVQRRERLLGDNHPDTLRAQRELAYALQAHQDLDESIALAEAVVRKQQHLLGKSDADTLDTENILVFDYKDKGEYDKGKLLAEEVLAGFRRLDGNDDPKALAVMNVLATILDDTGDYAGAAKLDEELLDARRRTLGAEHPTTIATLMNLAAAIDNSGDKARGFALKEEAWRLAIHSLGAENRITQVSTVNYASSLDDRGRYAEAEALFRTVVDVRTRTLGPDKPATLHALNNLADVLADEKRYAEAERLLQDVLARQRSALGPAHPDVLHTWRDLASALQLSGRDADAVEQSREMLDGYRKTFGPDSYDTLTVESALALSQFRLGQHDEALAQQQALLERARSKLGERNPETLQALGDLAQSLHVLHRDAEARPLQLQALDGLRAQFGDDAPHTVEARHRLQLIEQGKKGSAVANSGPG